MADFTTYENGDVVALSGGGNPASYPAVTVLHNTYDVTRGNVANGDTCTEFLKIPAGSYVLGVMLEVLSTEATVTVSVGDATDPDGYVAAQAVATAGRFAGDGAYVNTAGAKPTLQFYAADTWIEFTVGGADMTTASFRVAAVVANCG